VAEQGRSGGPPGVPVAERTGGGEGPAGIDGVPRGERPAVADELVDTEQEVLVRLALEVERAGAEGGGARPGPGLRGDDRSVQVVRGGGGPPGLRDAAPAPALTLDEVGPAVPAHP